MVFLSILLTAVVFAPYLWAFWAGRGSYLEKKNKGLLRCALHSIKPSKFELWDENFIGLDENQGRLFFTRFSDPESEVVLDCTTISRLELQPVKIRKRFQSRVEERLARLELHIYLNGTDVPRRISFYDILTHSGEDFEMARAQQWTASIRALIGAFTPGKRAA